MSADGPPTTGRPTGARPDRAVADRCARRRGQPARGADAAWRPPCAGVGVGTELAQLRPYEFGDDVRHIDAAATARTGQAHVRLHVPERALTTWIVLDLSPSMAFGTERRLKADVAEGVVLVFGRLGVRRAGSVGLVALRRRARRGCCRRAGPSPAIVALRRLLAEGVAPDGQHDPRRTRGRARAGWDGSRASPGWWSSSRTFAISTSWERPLGSLRVRHSVLAIEIVDPRELELPARRTPGAGRSRERGAGRDRHLTPARARAIRRARAGAARGAWRASCARCGSTR